MVSACCVLLNVFAASAQPAGYVIDTSGEVLPYAPNFNRILEYVQVPSRFVGTDTMLNAETFNDVPGVNDTADRILQIPMIRGLTSNRRSTRSGAIAIQAAGKQKPRDRAAEAARQRRRQRPRRSEDFWTASSLPRRGPCLPEPGWAFRACLARRR